MRSVFIYTLSDSATPDDVRYVGQSRDPRKRLRGHIDSAKRGERLYRQQWIRAVLAQHRTITQQIVAVANANAEADELEVRYIAHFRNLGHRLTNLSSGGQGTSGYRPTVEHRAKISRGLMGHRISPETKARIAQANRGGTGRRNYVHSEATKKRIGASNAISLVGKVQSLATRLKRSRSLKGRTIGTLTRQKLSLAAVAREQRKREARARQQAKPTS